MKEENFNSGETPPEFSVGLVRMENGEIKHGELCVSGPNKGQFRETPPVSIEEFLQRRLSIGGLL